MSNKVLTEACLVVSTLDPNVKQELLTWFIGLQLQVRIYFVQLLRFKYDSCTVCFFVGVRAFIFKQSRYSMVG